MRVFGTPTGSMAPDCMYLGGMTQHIDMQDIILWAVHRDDHYDYSQ